MVLEHVFPEDWLEKRGRYAFVLGVVYSVVGIFLASVLFPSDPALVAVAFTSLLLLPELYKIFSIEERQERMEKKFSFLKLWKDDRDVIGIYLALFLGILLVYALGAMILPEFQANSLFREQLEIRYGVGFAGDAVAGGAGGVMDLFLSLLSNNFLVLAAVVIVALLAGDGAIFLIAWNASVWGTIFGITAKNAALFSGGSAFVLFLTILMVVLPHVIIESLTYISGAVAASVVSKAVLMEKLGSLRFLRVASFNIYLILVALGLLVLGALVEAFVLEYATIYQKIIEMSYLFAG